MSKPSLLTRRLSVAASSSFSHQRHNSLLDSADTIDHNFLLYQSCSIGDTAAVATILDENANLDLNAKNGRSGSTALFAASLRGNKAIVELILATSECDVNLERNDGTTPLIIAAQEGHVEVVRMLLTTEQVDVNKANKGRSPLFMACYKQHVDVVQLLIAQKATNMNQQESEGGLTSLMIACSKGYTNVVDLLLRSNAVDVNAIDHSGQTAFFKACLHGFGDIIQSLSVHRYLDGSISRRADHSTALQVACMMGHTSDIIATILATRGTDVNHVNDDGYTALHYAEEAKEHDVVIMLNLLGGGGRRQSSQEVSDMCQVCRLQ